MTIQGVTPSETTIQASEKTQTMEIFETAHLHRTHRAIQPEVPLIGTLVCQSENGGQGTSSNAQRAEQTRPTGSSFVTVGGSPSADELAYLHGGRISPSRSWPITTIFHQGAQHLYL
ncbi:hypothetical protein [Ferrimicrobium sp.]|uniref:hypothetical protein n=1 Tax=Ferrimicrobium sp. TaxID=2926050 RepID=UPI002617C90D|nr:hypothetical protein [Ferrimicrobium sp.]